MPDFEHNLADERSSGKVVEEEMERSVMAGR